jgi:hypothetical protein
MRDQHLTTLAQGMDPQQQQEQASKQRQIELDSIFSTVAVLVPDKKQKCHRGLCKGYLAFFR